MPKKYLFSLLAIAFVSGSVQAEVWKCGGTYTDQPSRHKDCKKIEGSLVCGNAGTKYFAPKQMSGSTDSCEPSKKGNNSLFELDKPLGSMKQGEIDTSEKPNTEKNLKSGRVPYTRP